MVVGHWVDDAACRGCDPDVFYPPERDGYRGRIRQPAPADADLAKLICRECPVQVQCLRYAVDHGEPHGIWGGLTPKERHRLAAGPPPIPEMDHGTEAGSKAHRRRGETPCKACRDGAALASRIRHQKLREGRR